MDKITIPNFGTASDNWLSETLNSLSDFQKIHSDIHSRFCRICEILIEPGLFMDADSIYHKTFADGVIAEFNKVKSLIFSGIYADLASISNAKGGEVDVVNEPAGSEDLQLSFLKREVERFKNLEDNYIAARKALCNQDKELPHPQATWLRDSFDKDFEREKAVFADRVSHLILNK